MVMGERGRILAVTLVAIGIAKSGATEPEKPRRQANFDKGVTVACKEYQGISTKLHVCDPDSVVPGTCLTFCGHEMIGEAYFADGFYVGRFKHPRWPDGYGTLRDPGNKWIYKGLFVRGHREGEGTIEFADGLGWKGKWVADEPRGIGQWFIVGVGPLDQDTYQRRPSAERVKMARQPKSVAPPPPPPPRSAPAVSSTPARAAFAPAPLALPSTTSADARAAIEQAYAAYVQAATAATTPEARGTTLGPFAVVVFANLPPRPDGLALVAAQVKQLFESDFEAGFTAVMETYLPSGVSPKELVDAGRPARFEGCLTRRARWIVDAVNKKAGAGPRPICTVR